MVTLYNLVAEQPGFAHISTELPSLDAIVFEHGVKGVYDFQTVPNCQIINDILGNIILSHLGRGPGRQVVIINLFNDFPIHQISSNSRFLQIWLDQITVYTINSISQLIVLLQKLKGEIQLGTVVLMNDLHLLLDHYRLELSNSYQLALLRNHYQNNETVRLEKDRYELEGVKPNTLPIPQNSSLLKENPRIKYSRHLNFLFNLISQVCYANNLLVFITGNLDISFKPYESRPSSGSTQGSTATSQMSQMGSSSNPGSSGQESSKGSTSRKQGRLVLQYSNTSTYDVGPNAKLQTNILDSIITKRVMFYKDWYHRSPHYTTKSQGKALRQVYCAQVESVNGPPVFFDYKDKDFYKSEGDGLIDLSPPTIENDISNAGVMEYPPSSPNLTSQQSDILDQPTQPPQPPQSLARPSLAPVQSVQSVIEDSQDMGTPL